MQIHGIVYLLVGLFISGSSWYINSKAEDEPLLFFFYVGGVFLIIGVFKLVTGYITKPTRIVSKKIHPAEMGLIHTTHANIHARQVIYCPRCHSRLHTKFIYCPKCGTKVSE